MTATARLLGLLSLLQTRRTWSATTLASRLQVSSRTVRRDIDRLREMGYGITATMGPDGGYQLEAGHNLPPLLFDEDQVVALALALGAAAPVGHEDASIRALATLRQVMPSRLQHRLDTLRVSTVRRSGSAPPLGIELDVLLEVADLVHRRVVMRFDYVALGTSAASASRARRTEPHAVISSDGRWYLLGWDIDRDSWRTYRMDRVSPRAPHGPRFVARNVPGGSVEEFVAARFKGSPTDTWRCRGSVVLHLPAAEALPFAGDGSVTEIDDRRCRIEAGAWSWGALAASFGRFGVQIEHPEPIELAEAFGELAARYAAAAAPHSAG